MPPKQKAPINKMTPIQKAPESKGPLLQVDGVSVPAATSDTRTHKHSMDVTSYLKLNPRTTLCFN